MGRKKKPAARVVKVEEGGARRWRVLVPIAVVVVGAVAYWAGREPRDGMTSVPRVETSSPPEEAPPRPPLAPDSYSIAQAQLETGKRHALSAEWGRAITAFEEARRLAPTMPEAAALLAAMYLQAGRVDSAIAAYHEALRLSPEDWKLHDELGVAYGQKGNLDAALQSFQAAIRRNPGAASAYNNAGNAHLQRQQFEPAIEMFRKAIDRDATLTRAYGNLARIYFEQGRPEEARRLLERLLKADPNNAMARDVLKRMEEADRKASEVIPGVEAPAQ